MGKPIDDRVVESIERLIHTQRNNVPYHTTEEVPVLDDKGNPTGEFREQRKTQYRHIVEIYYCLKNSGGQFLANSNPIAHEMLLTDQSETPDNHAIVDLIEGAWLKEDTLKFTGNVI